MNVIFSAEAEADLERIGDYIAGDNPLRAESFVRELMARCYDLAPMPRAFPLVPRYEASGVRRRPYRDYLIFYNISLAHIEILHVLHGAQNYEAILFPDE